MPGLVIVHRNRYRERSKEKQNVSILNVPSSCFKFQILLSLWKKQFLEGSGDKSLEHFS